MNECGNDCVTNVIVLVVGVQAEVGPSVESEAGEPASPSAPAVPMIATVAAGENPMEIHNGT